MPCRYAAVQQKLVDAEQGLARMASEKLSSSALQDLDSHMRGMVEEVKCMAARKAITMCRLCLVHGLTKSNMCCS